MSEVSQEFVWTRLVLEPLPPGSASLLRRGQRHCAGLRRIRILRAETYALSTDDLLERIEILAPPDLVMVWNAPRPGEWSLVRVAAGYLLGLAEHVLEGLEDHIPF